MWQKYLLHPFLMNKNVDQLKIFTSNHYPRIYSFLIIGLNEMFIVTKDSLLKLALFSSVKDFYFI